MLPELALSDTDVATLSNLGKRFLNCGFGILLRSYREINQRIAALEFDRAFLIPALGDLIDLFCSCKPVPTENVVAIIGAAEVGVLLKHNVLVERKGLLRANGFRLIDHFGVLLFVGAQATLNTLYFGDDSTALGSWLLGVPRGRCLDLCCGVGTQTILCACQGKEAIGVERNKEAIRIAYINSALNGVTAKIGFYERDVIHGLADIASAVGRFDTICCNPPLLPVPENVAFSAVGNGGEDGLAFLAAILPTLAVLLEPEGRCYIIGTILGSAEQPDVTRIRRLVDDYALRAFMMVPAFRDIRRDEPFRKMLEYTSILNTSGSRGRDFQEVSNAWETLIPYGSHLYSYCLVATRANQNERGRLEFTRHFERNENFWYV
jgi:methylase of polypeptide subunit release factors